MYTKNKKDVEYALTVLIATFFSKLQKKIRVICLFYKKIDGIITN